LSALSGGLFYLAFLFLPKNKGRAMKEIEEYFEKGKK
jgi:hypothetical protein